MRGAEPRALRRPRLCRDPRPLPVCGGGGMETGTRGLLGAGGLRHTAPCRHVTGPCRCRWRLLGAPREAKPGLGAPRPDPPGERPGSWGLS